MITALVFDFSRVLLFAKDKNYKEDLNPLNKKLSLENPNYNFLNHFELNEEIVSFLETIKDKFDLHIFTSGSIQNNSAVKGRLNKVFKSIISAEEIGVSKKEPAGYLEVAKRIGKSPSEILFIDDSVSNIKAAGEAGLNTFQFQGNKELFTKLKSLL